MTSEEVSGLPSWKGDARLQLDDPLGPLGVARGHLGGQHVVDGGGAGAELHQRLVQRLRAGRVEVGQALVRVEGVGR